LRSRLWSRAFRPESLREYNTLKTLYDVVGVAFHVLNALDAL
jgi:hypothetical protein